MASTLFNRFNNLAPQGGAPQGNNVSQGNILQQLQQVQRDPGAILDIMLKNGKINTAQYNELQQYRNNPQQIVNYLMGHGKAGELNAARSEAAKFGGKG